jgi:thiol-disulfide isomerase/thioredoxin
MRNVCLCLAVILVVFVIPGMASGGNVPAAGDRLVDMRLPPPPSADKQAYLGLSDSTSPFDPTTIPGQLLIIEIFSMYCPHCQREAPAVNRLYQAIETSEALRGKVKMIGIGVGNSAFEVDHFRKHYKIEFRCSRTKTLWFTRQWVKFAPLFSSSLPSVRMTKAGFCGPVPGNWTRWKLSWTA